MTLLSHLRRGWVYLFGKPGPVARERLKADRQRQADAEALRKRIKADKAINHQPSPKPQNPTLPRMPAEGEVVEVHEGGRFSVVPGEYQPPEPDTPRPDMRILQALFMLPGPGTDRWRVCGLTRNEGVAYALVELRGADRWWKVRPLRQWQEINFAAKGASRLVLKVQRMDDHTLCVQDPPKGDGFGHWRVG